MAVRGSLAGAAAAIAAAVALAGALAAARAPEGSRTVVVVTIHHSRFVPASIVVERGSTVRFVVRNTDPIDHELIVGGPAVQERHESGTERSHGAVPGEVSVPAGGTGSTTYAFGSPGTLLIGCHLPGHWDYGMRGTVHVA